MPLITTESASLNPEVAPTAIVFLDMVVSGIVTGLGMVIGLGIGFWNIKMACDIAETNISSTHAHWSFHPWSFKAAATGSLMTKHLLRATFW